MKYSNLTHMKFLVLHSEFILGELDFMKEKPDPIKSFPANLLKHSSYIDYRIQPLQQHILLKYQTKPQYIEASIDHECVIF